MNTVAAALREAISTVRRTPVPLADLIPVMQLAADRIDRLTAALERLALECAECGGTRKVSQEFKAFRLRDPLWPRVQRVPSAFVQAGAPCTACADIWKVIETNGNST